MTGKADVRWPPMEWSDLESLVRLYCRLLSVCMILLDMLAACLVLFLLLPCLAALPAASLALSLANVGLATALTGFILPYHSA